MGAVPFPLPLPILQAPFKATLMTSRMKNVEETDAISCQFRIGSPGCLLNGSLVKMEGYSRSCFSSTTCCIYFDLCNCNFLTCNSE
eukprot:m.27741 g.27741  ORF g.27741 m.27741 type:complete len:86 (+) comp6469_c0_seq1:34-291(+)